MISPAATAFAASTRSAAELAKFFAAAPTEAADYTLRLAKSAGLQGPAFSQLQSLYEQGPAGADALKQFVAAQQALLSAVELAQTQAARAATLGVTAGPVAPVTITGRIGVSAAAPGNTDHPLLTTADGTTYDLVSPAIKQEGASHLYVQHRYLEANCLKAFQGMTVTLRAYATASPTQLAVQSFTPGTPKDFVSGRLAMLGDKLILRVLPDQNVEITNPTLKARLAPFGDLGVGNQVGGRLGIILPGAVKEQNGTLVYDELPENYWMLAKQTPGNPQLEMAHGQRHSYQGNVSAPQKWADQRIFVFGHIDETGNVVCGRQGALPMPPAIFEDGTPHVTDPTALAKLVPVQTADPSDFSAT